MRRVALIAACASLCLSLASVPPAAHARTYHYYSYGAHTPPKGSSERSAIMAAIHARTGITELLMVDHLRVSRGWAWAVVHPEGVDPMGVLLRGYGSHWSVSDMLDGDQFTSSYSELTDRFPNAPSSIFR